MRGHAFSFGLTQEPEPESEAALPLPEAQIATLTDLFSDFAEGCSFKPGDFVTPRKGRGIKGEGRPYVVLEVPAEPVRNFEAEPAETMSQAFGRRMDMRVAGYAHDGDIVAYWVESWDFEAYRGEDAA